MSPKISSKQNYAVTSRRIRLMWAVCWLAAGTLLFGGCRTLTSQSINSARIFESPELVSDEPQIQHGKPRKIIDAAGWVLGVPSKILLWDWRADNHHINVETEAAIADYLAENDLRTVRVRLNQYRPGEDWSRLIDNKSVGAPWRYKLGTLSVLGETLLPGRLVGGDHFNPYTNTIHLYSDIPAVARHEGGHAKDFARRKWKGTYAASYLVPIVPLYHESVASRDVVAYLESHGDPEQQAEARRILYPAYGTYVGSAAGAVFPNYANPCYYTAVLAGHAIGRYEARQILANSPTDLVNEQPLAPDSSAPSVQFASHGDESVSR